MGDKLLIILVLLICLPAILNAEQVKVMWENRFDQGKTPEGWTLSKTALWQPDGLLTKSVSNAEAAMASIKTEIKVPRAEDGYVLRAEWSLIPVKIGGWGQDLRMNNGPIVVEFTGNKPTLNARHASTDTVTEGKQVTITCDFNAYQVFSWKIDGKEQLKAPVAAWFADGDTIDLSLVDWLDTNSETKWQWIKISQVTPNDTMLLRLSGWDAGSDIKANVPSQSLVGITSPMNKVFREASDYSGTFGGTVKIAAAGREHESFQLVVMPVQKPLKNITAEVTDLVLDDMKTRFPASYIKWHPVGYVQTVSPGVRRKGWWWPDVLMPAKAFDVELGFVQPVWFTVSVPAKTKPGRYRGWITLKGDDGYEYKQKLELTVRPYDLPLRGKLRTAFCISPGLWEIWYKPDEVKKLLGMTDQTNHGPLYTSNEIEDVLPHEKWLEMYDFLLDHRISPTVIYSGLKNGKSRVVPSQKDMQYCYDRGMNATCLTNVDVLPSDPAEADKRMKDLEAYLRSWEGFVKEKNWKDFTWYVHGFDESEMRPDPAKNVDPHIRRVNGMIKEKFPWIKRETANPITKKNIGLFDIWTPITSQIDSEKAMAEVRKSVKRGEEAWAYVCCGPGKPYANFFIDFPGVDPRILGWQFYQYKLTGFLYYLINLYESQPNWNMNAPKWPDQPWNTLSFNTNSDGILIYPGPDMTPLASTRLENIRDGIEDYEALGVLSDLTDKLAKKGGNRALVNRARSLLAVPKEVSKSWHEYTQDPSVIESARVDVDKTIEEIMAALKSK